MRRPAWFIAAARGWALPAAALWLAGCSALQIDVDVYKGALLNEHEVQKRQHAYLVMSAWPLIKHAKSRVDEQAQPCGGAENLGGTVVPPASVASGAPAGAAAPAASAVPGAKPDSCAPLLVARIVLAELEEMYDGGGKGKASGIVADKSVPAVSGTAAGQGKKVPKLVDLMDDFSQSDDGHKETKLDSLNDVLIRFASKMLYIVNHDALYKTGGLTPEQRDLLQSLGNTLLLHTNDLQRQENRRRALKERAPDERDAIARAAQQSPAQAFEAIRQSLTGAPPAAVTPPADAARSPLAQARADESAADEALRRYLTEREALWAAYRTLLGEPAAQAGRPAPGPADLSAAAADRRAVATLHAAAPAGAAPSDALAPLRDWLGRERGDTVVRERSLRLNLVFQHLQADQARLLARSAGAKTPAAQLIAWQQQLRDDDARARLQLAELRSALDRAARLARELASGTSAPAETASGTAAQKAALAGAVGPVLERVREAVLKQAEAAHTTDEAALHTLLKLHLAQLQPGADGLPTREQITLTRHALQAYRPGSSALAAAGHEPVGKQAPSTNTENQIDVTDRLIAVLRAQRVQVLARGDAAAAENLLLAINVAYDQRTSMIYLRPASDYLRSVYSASGLQESSEGQYRNMLFEWWRYVPLFDKKESDERRRAELEKLHWQNINRVSLGGGGFTNFVLAKDDVGNWYVKAYASDPSSIIESATSLALFNAGSRLNVNLLQRYQLQKRLDGSTDEQEKEGLREQLYKLNSQDGRPLLALRQRYLARYETDTRASANKLLDQLTRLPGQVTAVVDAQADGQPQTCLQAVRQGLAPLDEAHLSTPREQLAALLQQLGVADERLLEKIERAVATALTAQLRYGARVQQAIDTSAASACEAGWRRGAAAKARALPRAQALALATERRTTIERYEEALVGLIDVAVQE